MFKSIKKFFERNTTNFFRPAEIIEKEPEQTEDTKETKQFVPSLIITKQLPKIKKIKEQLKKQ
jgi:hypothetical protein